MSKKGGYKIVSLGDLDLLDENLSLKGLYDALKVSYGKPILLTGIVIDGEHKKDALVQADEGANKINIKNLYGYDLEVAKSGDAITVSPSPDGIELPVPEAEDVGKVVKVDAEGKYALGDDASGMTNPMTTANDLIVGGANGAPTRLAVGAEGKLLKVGSSGIEWGDAPSGGTQLYKHVVSKNAISFTYISSSATPKDTTKTIGSYYIDGGLLDDNQHDIYQADYLLFGSPNPVYIQVGKYYYLDNDGGVCKDNLTRTYAQDFSTATDTVTAL